MDGWNEVNHPWDIFWRWEGRWRRYIVKGGREREWLSVRVRRGVNWENWKWESEVKGKNDEDTNLVRSSTEWEEVDTLELNNQTLLCLPPPLIDHSALFSISEELGMRVRGKNMKRWVEGTRRRKSRERREMREKEEKEREKMKKESETRMWESFICSSSFPLLDPLFRLQILYCSSTSQVRIRKEMQ